MEIERLYGSLDAISVQYRIASIDKRGHWDFRHVHYSSVIMSAGQVTASITVQVLFYLYLVLYGGGSVGSSLLYPQQCL